MFRTMTCVWKTATEADGVSILMNRHWISSAEHTLCGKKGIATAFVHTCTSIKYILEAVS
jgi:hypothetical protein